MEDEAKKRRERLKALRSLKAEISLKRMRQDGTGAEDHDQTSKERKTEEDEAASE